jgi:hypothetical protein
MPFDAKLLRIGTIACCLALGTGGLALFRSSRPASGSQAFHGGTEARGLHLQLGGTATFAILCFPPGSDTLIHTTAVPSRR